MWLVYIHYLKNKKCPFYVGIGQLKGRCMSLRNRNKKWWEAVKKNNGYSIAILFTGLTKEQACQKEKELIAKYGRYNLVNLTSGGQGNSDPTNEVRYKIGSANRNRRFSATHRERLSKSHIGKIPWNKGKKMSKEIIDRMKKKFEKGNIPWNKGLHTGGVKMTNEVRAKLSKALKGNKNGCKNK